MKQEFYRGFGKTTTTAEVLKVVEKLDIKGYIKDFHRNSNGDYNHLMNFFIWRRVKDKKPKSEYIRLTLMCEGRHEDVLFYWDLELSFKPFAYAHNHRENARIRSEKFKESETDKYYNYFLNMVDRIKGVERWG